MYNDEELMLFAESYQEMQKRGTAGKKIIGSVAERLTESIDTDFRKTAMTKMVKAMLESSKMAPAAKYLKSLSLREATVADYNKVEKLYKLYEEVADEEDPKAEVDEADEEEESEEDPDVSVIKAGFISDYKSDKLSLYKLMQGVADFGEWIMVHGKNEERNVMKAFLAVLEDEFIPKFSELEGAAPEKDDAEAEDSETEEEPAEDEGDEEVDVDVEEEPAEESEEDTEEVEEADDEEADIEIDVDEDDEEATDDKEVE